MSATRGDIAAVLKEAADTVGSADLPGDLRPVAYAKLLDYMLSGHLVDAPIDPPASVPRIGRQPTATGSGPLAALSSKLKLEPSTLERYFEFDDEGVHLLMPRSTLDSNKKGATSEVTYLVAAALQADGSNDSTSGQMIRNACDALGVLDETNFWKGVRLTEGKGIRIRGSGTNREVKINAVGYEHAAEIITRIANGDQAAG